MSTLSGYIVSKATNKRPASSASSSTMSGYIFNKFMNREESGQSFEEQLDRAFKVLGKKTSLIKREQYKQIDIATTLLEKQKDTQKIIADILNLVEERTTLEKQYYKRILENQTSSAPVELEEPPAQVEEAPEPEEPPSLQPEKLAAGGTTQVTQPTEGDKNITEKDQQIKFADVMQLQPKASGTAAVSILGEFLSTLGPLAGFFRPFVKDKAKPFAISMGVNQSIIESSLGGSIVSGELKLKEYQKQFAKTWISILNNSEFVDQYIDRESDDVNDPTKKPTGYVPADWKDDPEFSAALNELCQKWGINANHLLGLMAIETASAKINPAADNGHHAGLIQFSYGFIKNTANMSVEDFKKLSRAQQIPYVDKFFDRVGLPKNPTAAQLYTSVFLPAFIPYATDRNTVLASKDGHNSTPLGKQFTKGEIIGWWKGNPALHGTVKDDITVGDLEDKIKSSTQSLGLSFETGGGFVQEYPEITQPTLIAGPLGGFKANIAGVPLFMHGLEFAVPVPEGLQIYPFINRKYNFFENPERTVQRWKEIDNGDSTTSVNAFASGGTAAFWQLAAITAKEDTLHRQGQADVAQSLYNRVAVGTYPGGKNLLGIITAPGQFEPTFKNPSAWASIKDRTTAIAAAGSQKLVDMAAQSITSPSLQKEAARFVGGRTDFQGESQKPHMKPEDVTRGKNHNFFGWFYDARLPKPAPVPKMVSAAAVQVSSGSGNKPKIIVNQVGGGSSPSFIQQVQQTITRLIPVPVFNSQRLRTELNMKRTK